MTFTFDMDGTIIGKRPDAWIAIMKGLMMQGHTVVVLTGSVASDPTDESDKDLALARAGFFKNEHYTSIVIVEGHGKDRREELKGVSRLKGEQAYELKADFSVDDNESDAWEIKRRNPLSVSVQVIP